MSSTRSMVLFGLPLIGVLAAVACSDEPPLPGGDRDEQRATGSLELGLDIADGVEVQTVQYEIQGGPQDETIAGDINVSQPGSTASVEKFGLLPGDYSIEMSAASDDGSTSCDGSADFVIVADEVTEVTVILECTGGERFGGVRVNAELQRCLELSSVVVSPLRVAVGYDIDVSALVGDYEPTLVGYQWSARVGTFADPTAAETTYRCEEPGDVELIIDAIALDDPDCGDSFGVVVTCRQQPLCGNGQIDDGEECDPPNSRTCDDSCSSIASSCGNDVVDQGEDCDPPDGVFCSETCRRINPCAARDVCSDENDCTADTCAPDPDDNSAVCSNDPLPNGDSCGLDRGTCDDGECIIEDDSLARDIPVVCRESVFGELFESSFLLRANPLSAVTPGVPVDVMFSGGVEFPQAVLQAAVDALPGLTEVTLTQLQATVEVRSGASGDGPAMGSNLDLPAMLPLELETDPVSCRAMGQNTPCVISPLSVSFAPTVASLQPDGAAASILVGWATGASPDDFDPTGPVGQLGIRLQAVVLAMGVECIAGRIVGGQLTPLTDAELLPIPIE